MNEPAKIEKVTDDALSRSIISSVIGILLCMVCLVGTTWAWYSLSVESGNNEMTGANFDFRVAITEPFEATDGVYTFAGGLHTVTLTKVEGCTATKGFCKVIATKVGGEAETTIYYTVDFTDTGSIEFSVTGSGTLELIPMWGTPASEYTVIPGEGIQLALPASKTMPQQKEEVSQEETTSEEGEPIDEEPDDNETIESGEGGENVNENETPDETPANPDTTEQEPPTEPISEPMTEQPVEPPAETTQN